MTETLEGWAIPITTPVEWANEASMACALRNPDEMIRHAGRANAMVNEFLNGAAEILNAREFEDLFDIAPHTTVAVIMPDIVNELIPCAGRP